MKESWIAGILFALNYNWRFSCFSFFFLFLFFIYYSLDNSGFYFQIFLAFSLPLRRTWQKKNETKIKKNLLWFTFVYLSLKSRRISQRNTNWFFPVFFFFSTQSLESDFEILWEFKSKKIKLTFYVAISSFLNSNIHWACHKYFIKGSHSLYRSLSYFFRVI